jgi:hypothetical protein
VKFLKVWPWLWVLFAIGVPFGAARADFGNTSAAFALIASITALVITAAVLIGKRGDENGALTKAGDYLRELGRANYIILIATMLGTGCALAVLLSAIVSSPPGQGRTQTPVVVEQAVQRPPAGAKTGVANQKASQGGPTATSVARDSGVGALDSSTTQKWYSQFPSAVEAFLGGFATILAVGLFYRRLAPYTDMWELLGEISNDVNRLLEKTSKSKNIWWVYPGFALGRFRSLNENGSPNSENNLYELFKSVLYNAFGKDTVNINAIVYSNECLESFYRAYSFQATIDHSDLTKMTNSGIDALALQLTSHKKSKRVSKCLRSETDLIDVCKTSGAGLAKLYKAMKPDAMPPFVIVIGSIVYQISNYGSPIFVPSEPKDAWESCFKSIRGVFWPSAGRNASHLLQLVAYRRDDAAFAKTVTNHIERHIDAAVSAGVAKVM